MIGQQSQYVQLDSKVISHHFEAMRRIRGTRRVLRAGLSTEFR